MRDVSKKYRPHLLPYYEAELHRALLWEKWGGRIFSNQNPYGKAIQEDMENTYFFQFDSISDIIGNFYHFLSRANEIQLRDFIRGYRVIDNIFGLGFDVKVIERSNGIYLTDYIEEIKAESEVKLPPKLKQFQFHAINTLRKKYEPIILITDVIPDDEKNEPEEWPQIDPTLFESPYLSNQPKELEEILV